MNLFVYLYLFRYEEAAESYMHMLTINPDKIIINLKSGSINNIESSIEVLQKFIVEQVIYLILIKDFQYLNMLIQKIMYYFTFNTFMF